jgi:DNA-directed RNA polymerase subunit omega
MQYQEDNSTDGLTSELAVQQIGNRYDLVLVAAQRLRELHRGDMPRVVCRGGPTITALKEIEQGKVGLEYLLKDHGQAPRRRRASMQQSNAV